jgi:hypothetical protein
MFMEQTAYDDLIERVRNRCRPEAQEEHPEGFAQTVAEVRGRWPWPVATAEQLAEMETLLGFPIPPLLRRLYAEVGNGAFGPAYGLIGVVGGAPHPSGWYDNLVEGYGWYREYIELSSIPSAQRLGEWFELPNEVWPRYLLPLRYWGCNTMHAVHAQSGEVFCVVDAYAFAHWAPSLETWLETWLEQMTLTPEQARLLLETARVDRLEALYLVALTTGMREGELFALKWRDVNVDTGAIHVRATLKKSDAGLITTYSKTSRSRRQIALTQVAVEALRRQRARQSEERLAVGPAWRDGDFVFTDVIGGLLR